MKKSIHQLEKRLNELESLRTQRQNWLNDLVAPMTDRLQYLAKLRRDHVASANSNVIRFPLERLLENRTRI